MSISIFTHLIHLVLFYLQYLAGLCRHTYLSNQGTDARDLFSFAVLSFILPSVSLLACILDLFFSAICFFFLYVTIPLLLGLSLLYSHLHSNILYIPFRQVIALTLLSSLNLSSVASVLILSSQYSVFNHLHCLSVFCHIPFLFCILSIILVRFFPFFLFPPFLRS